MKFPFHRPAWLRSSLSLLVASASLAHAATITWDGGGGDANWHNPLNWSGDQVPGSGDDVVIGPGVAVDARASVTIEGFQLGGGGRLVVGAAGVTFTATSESTVEAAATLQAESGGQLVLAQLTSLSAVSMHAVSGGVLTLPALTRYAGGSGFNDTVAVSADGIGSTIDLPALTFLEGRTGTLARLGITASGGGRVLISELTEVLAGSIGFSAQGDGSRVELPKLANFTHSSLAPGLRVVGGGVLALPRLASATSLPLEASGGGVLSLPALARYSGGAGFNDTVLVVADGVNSTIDLPALTFLEGRSGTLARLGIAASGGGRILMQQVATLSGGSSGILSDGKGSLVDFSSLSQIASPTTTSMEARNQGVIALPASVNLAGVTVTGVSPGIVFPVRPQVQSPSADQTVVVNSPAQFTVLATGTDPILYQWQFEFPAGTWRDLNGQTAPTLTFASATFADEGSYRVVLCNVGGITISQPARLSVIALPPPPQITAQPQGRTVVAGQSVTFTVAATGTAPLAYQWRKGDQTILNETDSSLTLNTVETGDAGSYSVVVSNAGGSVTSDPAVLTVTPVTPDCPPAQLTAVLVPGLWVEGTVGCRFRIEFSPTLTDPVWQPLDALTLSQPRALWVDRQGVGQPVRYYRAVATDETATVIAASTDTTQDIVLRWSLGNPPYDLLAQSFRLPATAAIEAVLPVLGRRGAPAGRLWFTLETDDAGKPSGQIITAGTSEKPQAAIVPSEAEFAPVRFGFADKPLVEAGRLYWLGLHCEYGTLVNENVRWRRSNAGAGTYPGGDHLVFDGTGWHPQEIQPTDFAFQLLGLPIP